MTVDPSRLRIGANCTRDDFDDIRDPTEGYDPLDDWMPPDAGEPEPTAKAIPADVYGADRLTAGSPVLYVIVGTKHRQIVDQCFMKNQLAIVGVEHLADVEYVILLAKSNGSSSVVVICGKRAGVSDLTCEGLVDTAKQAGIGIMFAAVNMTKALTREVIERAAFTAAPLTGSSQQAGDYIRTKAGDIVLDDTRNIRQSIDECGVKLRYNELADDVEGAGLPEHVDDGIMDEDTHRAMWIDVRERTEAKYDAGLFGAAVADYARRDSYHPVRDYLAGLKWDGVARLDRWLVSYAGADDTPYVRAVGPLTLIAGVRRVRQPGVKFDTMLVMEGPQGTGKSSLLKRLAVRDEWFADELPLGEKTKDLVDHLRGKWLVEAGELSSLNRAELGQLKMQLSASSYRARLSYARQSKDFPRQSIFIGTVNPDGDGAYLRDPTGARRFWPISTGEIRLEQFKADVDQLWAEAAEREAAGESIELERGLWPAAAEQQEQRQHGDPFVDTLRARLDGFNGWMDKEVAWSILGVAAKDQTPPLLSRLNSALKAIGFVSAPTRVNGLFLRQHVRGDRSRVISAQINPVNRNVTVFSNPKPVTRNVTGRVTP